MNKPLKTTEKIYLADSLIMLNNVLGEIYDGIYVEEGLIDKFSNESLGAMIESLMDKIERRIDGEE